MGKYCDLYAINEDIKAMHTPNKDKGKGEASHTYARENPYQQSALPALRSFSRYCRCSFSRIERISRIVAGVSTVL